MKKFEKELIGLCKRFGFDIERRPSAHEEFVPVGKLEYSAASELVKTLSGVRSKRLEIERGLDDLREENKTRRPGRSPISRFILEQLLVGLRLQQGSREGQKRMRELLLPGGPLEAEFKKRGAHEEAFNLIKHDGDQNLQQWASKKQQSYERAILSELLGRDIKVFSAHKDDLKELRLRVKADGQQVLKLVLEQQRKVKKTKDRRLALFPPQSLQEPLFLGPCKI